MTVGPENPLRVELDDTAQLECSVDAKPAVSSVKWMRAGRFIDTNFRHTIPRVGMDHAGKYVCLADNGLGQVRDRTYIFPQNSWKLIVPLVFVQNNLSENSVKSYFSFSSTTESLLFLETCH